MIFANLPVSDLEASRIDPAAAADGPPDMA